MIHFKDFKQFKVRPLVAITAYDACFAPIAESAGVDLILVGDSLANVVLGLKRTQEVDMSVMILFVQSVVRSIRDTHITADMPYGAYPDPETALKNARAFMEAGAHSVKIEGALPDVVKMLSQSGVPVMGHLGLLPQTARSLKQVGHDKQEKEELLQQARDLEEHGAFTLVLEHMDFDLAKEITRNAGIPTIGIGAGQNTDGQVMVLHDALGMNSGPLPPFVKKFSDLREEALKGLRQYADAVRNRTFP